MGDTPPPLRVGDRERRAVDDRLLAAVGDGVLTLHEYDERSAVLWQARTRVELDELVADLPDTAAVAPPAPPAVPGTAGRPRWVVAVMSEDRLSGSVSPGQRVRSWAVMGKAVVDLRRDDLPSPVEVQVRSLMGEVEVLVPPGAAVHLTGFSLMGERKVQVGDGSGPEVHVDAVAVMGSVKVTHGDGSVVRSGRPPAAVPLPRPASLPVPHSRAVHRPGRHLPRLLGRARAWAVPAALLGALVLAGPDNVSIFGDEVERVARDDRNVQISSLWGDTTVIVPNGSRVDTGGFFPFGDTSCEGECREGDGPEVHVRTFGAFGDVTIVTERQDSVRRAREGAEDRSDDERDEDDD